MSNGDLNFVFVVGPDTTVAMRPVVVGQRMPRWAAITSGLKEGESVVVEGHQKIGPGMKVALAPPEKAAAYRSKELHPPTPEASASTNSPPAADSPPPTAGK